MILGERGAFDAVHAVIERYFEGLYQADANLLEAVFHPRAIYCSEVGTESLFLSLPDYLEVVRGRRSPASRGEKRQDEIQSIEFAGDALARVRLRCAIGERHFTDFLTLLQIGGAWKIVSKAFHYEMMNQKEERCPTST